MKSKMLYSAVLSVGVIFAQDTVQIERAVTKAVAGVRVQGIAGGLGGNMIYSSQVVKNQPYSAEEVTETTQTLGDGTHINQKSSHSIFRDAEGRVRRENGDEVTISDPVASASFILNPRTQTARKLPFASGGDFFFKTIGPPPPGGGKATIAIQSQRVFNPAVPPPPGDLPTHDVVFFTNGKMVESAQPATENLGTQVIEGVAAQGTRMTMTIAAGAIGNDRAMNIVDEHWFSPELQIPMMTSHSDPRDGETKFRLTNVRRTPPDPTLFQVPAGYQVIAPGKE